MSYIILPQRRKIIVPDDPIVLPYTVKGMFRCQVRRADRSLRVDTGWFPNLITNQGLDYLGNSATYLQNCMVGTGNSTPANTDTVLNAQVAYAPNNSGSSPNNGAGGTYPNLYGYLNMFYAFGQGAAAGNLQEIGIGPDGTHCFSRALILNGVGSPTTLTILADEYLDVSYQLQLWAPTTDVTGSVNVSGTVCNYTMRAANAATPGGNWGFGGYGDYPKQFGLWNATVYNDTVLQPINSQPIGTSQGYNDNGVTSAGYTLGNYYIDGTVYFSFSQCNGGANNSALVNFGYQYGGMGAAQIIFGATIPKTSSQIMTLTFRQSWARH